MKMAKKQIYNKSDVMTISYCSSFWCVSVETIVLLFSGLEDLIAAVETEVKKVIER